MSLFAPRLPGSTQPASATPAGHAAEAALPPAPLRLSRLENAALVVTLLAPGQAARVLHGLRSDDLRRFARAIERVRSLDAETTGRAVTEFLTALAQSESWANSTASHADGALAVGPQAAEALLRQVMDSADVARLLDSASARAGDAHSVWQRLETLPAPAVAKLLTREHAQTVAAILNRLRPASARAILAAMPPRLAQRAALRMNRTAPPDEGAIATLAAALADTLAESGADTGADTGANTPENTP